MTARWFNPKVAALMSAGTVAHHYRQGKKRPVVIIECVGTVVWPDFKLPDCELRFQAFRDFVARRRETPYLREHPGLVAEFEHTLEEFERLAGFGHPAAA